MQDIVRHKDMSAKCHYMSRHIFVSHVISLNVLACLTKTYHAKRVRVVSVITHTWSCYHYVQIHTGSIATMYTGVTSKRPASIPTAKTLSMNTKHIYLQSVDISPKPKASTLI